MADNATTVLCIAFHRDARKSVAGPVKDGHSYACAIDEWRSIARGGSGPVKDGRTTAYSTDASSTDPVKGGAHESVRPLLILWLGAKRERGKDLLLEIE